MSLIISLVAFLLLLGGIFLAVVAIVNPKYTETRPAKDENGLPIKNKNGYNVTEDVKVGVPARWGLLLGGILLAFSGIFMSGVKIIEPGNVGVVVTAGTVDHTERQSGITWVRPFIDDVISFSTRREVRMFENLGAASKEYQDVFLTGVLQYNIDPDGASELYVTYNNDFVNQTLFPTFSDTIKTITPKFSISDVLPQRDIIRAQTLTELRKRLAGSGINVVDVSLSQIAFNPEYEDAIKQKQVEFERIATERNILQQRNVQAEQIKAQAKGEADAAIEKAKGAAEAVRLARSAEAEGNKLVAQSLTQPILTQMAIDKFNPTVNTILWPVGGDSSSFIFPPEFLEQPSSSPTP